MQKRTASRVRVNRNALGLSRKSGCQARSQTRPQPATLLWIDDYQPGLDFYRIVFEQLGFRVLAASHPRVGVALAVSQPIDAVITDYEMPDMNGAAVAAELKRRSPDLPVILFTGTTSLPAQLRNCADAICDKAAPFEKLLAVVKQLVVKHSTLPLQPPSLRPSSQQGQPMVA